MTDVLLPISSPGPANSAREALLGGARSVMSVRPQGVESAAALRPVDPAALAKDIRLDSRRDLPVGPPPTFKINVLEHLHASLLAPPPPADTGAEAPEPEANPDDAPPLAVPSPAAPPVDARYAENGVSIAQDTALNKIV